MKVNSIKLSPEFKSRTTRAILAILLFALIYLILLTATIALTILCMYAGIKIIMAVPKFIVIILGVGMASFGVLILIFLLKFMFKSHKIDRSHLYEIKKEEAPELFAVVEDIVHEVGTRFPKKIYLSSDVNAAVFYDSSFWSMFLPVRKNLQIGLGLMNTLTNVELKAVLSHEFGHFSQRTMKVGSYVYNVNKVIFDMLYNNDTYSSLVQGWGNIHGFIGLFVVLAVRVITGIQWLLKTVYNVVNKSYMGLSREMEFQADEIAACITGSMPLKVSLLRSSLSDRSLQEVISFYERQTANNLKSENVYREQAYVLRFLAEDNNIPIVNNYPEITLEYLNKFDKSKLIIKDQWASHPSIFERIERLDQLSGGENDEDITPANTLIKNIENLQQQLTGEIFQHIEYKGDVGILSLVDFQKKYQQEQLDQAFPKLYNNYYNKRFPARFDVKACSKTTGISTAKELFSDKQVELVDTALALQNDITCLRQIADKKIPVKTFDYDGKKYKKKSIKKLLPELEQKLEQINEQIRQNDSLIFQLFEEYERKLSLPAQLENMYEEFFSFDEIFDIHYAAYVNVSNAMQFVRYTNDVEVIKDRLNTVYSLEAKFKDSIIGLLTDNLLQDEISPDVKENFERYVSKQWYYFQLVSYDNDNLQMLFKAMDDFVRLMPRKYFLRKQKLLTYQAGLYQQVDKSTM